MCDSSGETVVEKEQDRPLQVPLVGDFCKEELEKGKNLIPNIEPSYKLMLQLAATMEILSSCGISEERTIVYTLAF
jgi:hypothetical protein